MRKESMAYGSSKENVYSYNYKSRNVGKVLILFFLFTLKHTYIVYSTSRLKANVRFMFPCTL